MNTLSLYRLGPGFSIHYIDPDRIILLHETKSITLSGKLYIDVLKAMVENQQEKLTGLNQAEILFALDYLERKGYLEKITPESPVITWCRSAESQPHFNPSSFPPLTVLSTKSSLKVLMEQEIKAAQLTLAEYPNQDYTEGITIILGSDYLEESMSNLINQAFIQGSSACYPVKLSGHTVWCGPLLQKKQRPCWSCLHYAIKRNRPVENYLGTLTDQSEPVLPLYLISSLSIKLGICTALIQLLKKMGLQGKQYLDTDLITLNLWDLKATNHHIRIRPQCSHCGHPSQYADHLTKPVTLTNRSREYTNDGGYRANSPKQTWEEYQHLISPITGIISHLDIHPQKHHYLRPVYKATYMINPPPSAVQVQERFVKNSYGKGQTNEQSRVSALGEAVERYASLYTGEEPQIRANYTQLQDQAIDPTLLINFSDSQYAQRDEYNCQEKPQSIPLPFNNNHTISWTPIWSLNKSRHLYAPLQFCYSLTPTPEDENMCPFSSNGNAAGNYIEEAILQGLLELIERDATAIWWYNRVMRPEINLVSFNNPYFRAISEHYNDLGWHLWVLDITHDLQIPVVVALARNNSNHDFVIGLGCHLDMSIAIQRAITEMHQTFDPQGDHEPIWNERDIEKPAFLFPTHDNPYQATDYLKPPDRSLFDDIRDCVEKLEDSGLEVLVLNYTRPDIRMPTTKVIVPGLRHFWQRLGPGRLYTVPVLMQWSKTQATEKSLNPLELAL